MIESDKTAIERHFAAFITAQTNVRGFWVGLSGGIDSCVLLHLLARNAPTAPVRVLHINHQLSPRANEWQAHCQALAAEYGFEFVAERVHLEKRRRGLEKAAREARYAAFAAHVAEGEMLLLAHHLDDQAETVMLRLLRGTGLRGLGGMAALRPLGEACAARPLLPFSRQQLLDYALAHSLQWVEDESNQSRAFDRNFLRHEVMPLLAHRWPKAAERFGRTAELLRENEVLLNEYAAQDLVAAERRCERFGESVSMRYLAGLSEPRRNAILRYWLQCHDCQPPEQVHLQEARQFFTAAEDAQPKLVLGTHQLLRYGQRLYLLPMVAPRAAPGSSLLNVLWRLETPLSLPDGSCLRATPAKAGLRADREYHVRLRQGGERCHPNGRPHSQKLKKLLQEYGLEPWLRDRVPVIYAGNEIAAVGDLWVCKAFHVEGEPAWTLEWGEGGACS